MAKKAKITVDGVDFDGYVMNEYLGVINSGFWRLVHLKANAWMSGKALFSKKREAIKFGQSFIDQGTNLDFNSQEEMMKLNPDMEDRFEIAWKEARKA